MISAYQNDLKTQKNILFEVKKINKIQIFKKTILKCKNKQGHGPDNSVPVARIKLHFFYIDSVVIFVF